MIANHVVVLSKEVAPTFSARDVSKIKKFCRNSRYVSVCVYLFILQVEIVSELIQNTHTVVGGRNIYTIAF